MDIQEAIRHCEEKAEELRHEVETWVHCPNDTNNEKNLKDFEDCKECARDHEQLAKWLTELVRLESFEKHEDTYEDGDYFFTYTEFADGDAHLIISFKYEVIETVSLGMAFSHYTFVEYCKKYVKEREDRVRG